MARFRFLTDPPYTPPYQTWDSATIFNPGALVCCIRFWYTHDYPTDTAVWYGVYDANTGELVREANVSPKPPGQVNGDGMWWFADKTRNVYLVIGPYPTRTRDDSSLNYVAPFIVRVVAAKTVTLTGTVTAGAPYPNMVLYIYEGTTLLNSATYAAVPPGQSRSLSYVDTRPGSHTAYGRMTLQSSAGSVTYQSNFVTYTV